MSVRVILSPDAEEDFHAAIRWYVHIELGLSLRFKADAQRVLLRVGQNPYQFPLGPRSIRKALLRRFPYAIYFTVNAASVMVLAIFHQRRSTPWNEP